MRNNHLKNGTPTHTDINRLRKGQVGGQVCFELSVKINFNTIISFGRFIHHVIIKERMQR